MASKRGGVERVLAKLHASVEQGNYYEAHQMYRTLYFRYRIDKSVFKTNPVRLNS